MKRATLAAACAVLATCWMGPLPQLAQRAFFAHMAVHMLVVAAAAPLLAMSVAGTRADPVARWPHLFPPLPVSLVELVVVWAWHMPALHHAARHDGTAFVLEQTTFLLSGLLLWLAVLGGGRVHRAAQGAAGVAALLLTSMHMTLLGALLALSPRPLFAHHGSAFGLSALEDQHLGGAFMLLVGGLTYTGGGLWLMSELLRARRREGEALS